MRKLVSLLTLSTMVAMAMPNLAGAQQRSANNSQPATDRKHPQTQILVAYAGEDPKATPQITVETVQSIGEIDDTELILRIGRLIRQKEREMQPRIDEAKQSGRPMTINGLNVSGEEAVRRDLFDAFSPLVARHINDLPKAISELSRGEKENVLLRAKWLYATDEELIKLYSDLVEDVREQLNGIRKKEYQIDTRGIEAYRGDLDNVYHSAHAIAHNGNNGSFAYDRPRAEKRDEIQKKYWQEPVNAIFDEVITKAERDVLEATRIPVKFEFREHKIREREEERRQAEGGELRPARGNVFKLNGFLAGSIVGDDDEVLENAKFIVNGINYAKNGTYKFEAETGSYTITIKAEGYKDLETPAFIQQGRAIENHKIPLQRE